jgi:hypothetical protein
MLGYESEIQCAPEFHCAAQIRYAPEFRCAAQIDVAPQIDYAPDSIKKSLRGEEFLTSRFLMNRCSLGLFVVSQSESFLF